MRIVIAPNAFKESLTAIEAAEAIAIGVRRAIPQAECILKPVADGGDGLLDAAETTLGGERISLSVPDPLGRLGVATYLFYAHAATADESNESGGLAVIEMARASGLALIPTHERNPLNTSTLGTGVLAKDAIHRGAKRIAIGLGGSATVDGGCGFISAFGARYLDENGNELFPCGGTLSRIHTIDWTKWECPSDVVFEGICDVDNPLLGPRGAASVFAPQKGASPADVADLETGLAHWADLLALHFGHNDYPTLAGAGAAGGFGYGLAHVLGASLKSGIEAVMDWVHMDEALHGSALCFTGEGRLDIQTAGGKAPAGVATHAKKAGVPCIILAGSVEGELSSLREMGMTAAFSIARGPASLAECMQNAGDWLTLAAEETTLLWMNKK